MRRVTCELRVHEMAEVSSILGCQAAHVTKPLDTKAQLKTERGIQAARKEFKRMMSENHVWDLPQDLTSVADNAIIVKGKLLISLKHDKLPAALQLIKARFVGMGNSLFNKSMRVSYVALAIPCGLLSPAFSVPVSCTREPSH